MRKHTVLYLTAAITLTLGMLCASDFTSREATVLAVPFYIGTGVLAYYSYAIWKWGKKPTLIEEANKRISKKITDLVIKCHPYTSEIQTKCHVMCHKLSAIHDIYGKKTNATIASNNIQILQYLLENYIQLAENKFDLENSEVNGSFDNITNDIRKKRLDLEIHSYSPEIKDSKNATIDFLIKRLEISCQNNSKKLAIESDMQRIEAQFDLILEEVSTKSAVLPYNIKLISDLILEDTDTVQIDKTPIKEAN